MSTTTINYEIEFTDGSTYKISVGPYRPTDEAVTEFKSRIMANKNMPNPLPNWYDYIVNSDGAKLRTDTYITRAWYETSAIREIPLND